MKTLEHLQATENQLAERYLLGELPPDEAEDFELHYFECSHCAMAVEAGQQFIANARVALAGSESQAWEPLRPATAELPRNSFRDRLRVWWRAAGWKQPSFAIPMAAAFAFGIVALYQGVVLIPGVHRGFEVARALPAFQLAGASRGDALRVRIPAGTTSFAVSVDIPPDAHFAKYVCILSERGRDVFRVVAPAPADGLPITILVPVKGLQTGNQELTVSGLGPDGRETDKILVSPFVFEFNQ